MIFIKNYPFLKGLLIDSKHVGGRALMNTVVHLRKLCNHPFLFPTVEEECQLSWKVKEISGYWFLI